MRPANIRTGDVVVVQAFDEVPEHEFLVEEVHEDLYRPSENLLMLQRRR